MARVIAGMTMSLDGFVADTEGDAGVLYPDLAELQDSSYPEALQDQTGAVLMGRRTFDMAGDPDSYADTYELQVPIVVVTHSPPPVAPSATSGCSSRSSPTASRPRSRGPWRRPASAR